MSNRPGFPDHAAQPLGLLDSPAIRTLVQGVIIDLATALCLVVLQATDGKDVDWRLLGFMLAKTAAYTVASSLMKRLRPARPEGTPPAG